MILAADIGNSNTTFGLFKGEKLLSHSKTANHSIGTGDNYFNVIDSLCNKSKISMKDLQGVVVSSVVPGLTDRLSVVIDQHIHLRPVIISGTMDIGMKLHYDDPSTLGADRVCNVVAARKKFGGPAIVIDFGTAITYDVISSEGVYLGGIIAPGAGISAWALQQRTAKLPEVQLTMPPNLIGTNTTACIQSGIMFGAIDTLEGMIKRLKKIVGNSTTVVGTGGYVESIAHQTSVIDNIEPFLVLEGARLIYDRIDSNQK